MGCLLSVAVLASGCGDDGGDADRDAANDGDSADAVPPEPFYGGHQSDLYAGTENWLCHPDLTDDVCSADLDATAVHADGTTEVIPHQAAEDPPVDCFYVYPTVSFDESPNTDLQPGESEEIFATLHQAARLTASCRLYVPLYRQMTLSMIGGGENNEDVDPWGVAYADVLDAFKHYIDNENQGRGFVLVGHSQGAAHLRQLLMDEIDDEPELRHRLVSAMPIGWGVNVPEGDVVGGDLENIPACEASDQTGCVLSFSSFRSEPAPPERPAYGVAESGQVLCVNPVEPGIDGTAFSQPYFELNPVEGSVIGDTSIEPFTDPARNQAITTPWVTFPDFIEVECRAEGGVSYLAVTVHGDPNDERLDDIGGDLDLGGEGVSGNWGLHRVDVSIVMGDLVDLVAGQAEAYTG